MCSRIYIQLLFDDSNAFFRLDFCNFSLCHVSFVIVTGCKGFQKDYFLCHSISFPFTSCCIGLRIAFFRSFTPFIYLSCHSKPSAEYISPFSVFLFYLLGSVISYYLPCHLLCICIVLAITCSYVSHFLSGCFKDTYTMTFLDFL